MTIHPDDQIAALIQKHWRNLQGAGKLEMQQAIARISEALANQTGNPYHGKKLYDESCAKCHKLFGKGNTIGPELTTYKRDDTLGILLNIVNPSAEIREGYESYLVVTDDGRVMTGLMIDQDQHSVALRGADGQNISIPRSNIDQFTKQTKSLMPEGLLEHLTEEQVRDLFAYLKITQPF